ncbi:MAG: 16S rRNA (cytidine(1402)-2'-O)-methyltransferase [Deltaproteobacteria bacterium]|nr:16S rRNA (cytidine(1402)-2'-O)-methyltransferase [Deltaproteobacteria bacterium]
MNLPAVDASQVIEKGALYVVATPIGNIEDITLRALRVLSGVDMVAAEDTRHTGRMLSQYQISSPLISYHDHNEAERAPQFIQKLLDGISIALVSDAGTPSVSDPGYRLICAAIQAGVKVIPVPGVSAAIAALSVSGLPTDAFVFLGFPPKKQARRIAMLKDIENEARTLIFYESPKRVLSFLNDALAVLGDRSCVVCREMTKRYEEFIRGPISEMLADLSGRREIKGECTLVLSGKNKDKPLSAESLESSVSEFLMCPAKSPGELARKIALKFGISRKTAYQMILSEKAKGRQ